MEYIIRSLNNTQKNPGGWRDGTGIKAHALNEINPSSVPSTIWFPKNLTVPNTAREMGKSWKSRAESLLLCPPHRITAHLVDKSKSI